MRKYLILAVLALGCIGVKGLISSYCGGEHVAFFFDCRYFVQCDDFGGRKIVRCPLGLWFDRRSKTCNWPNRADCNGEPLDPYSEVDYYNNRYSPYYQGPVPYIQPADDVPKDKPCYQLYMKPDEYKVDPEDPHAFFVCQDTIAYHFKCAGDTCFNEAKNECDYACP